MTVLEALLLGILQGLTEFLPVSSSGHLAVAEHFLDLHSRAITPETLEAFNVLVHVATLAAVVIVFRKAIVAALTARRRLIPLYVLGCIPAGAAGVLIKLYGQELMNAADSSMVFVGAAFALTGVLLFLTRYVKPGGRGADGATAKDALVVGLFQVAALLPGVSRSGTTISGGLFAGLERPFAARFSFIMVIPLILGAAALDAKHLVVGCPITPAAMAAGFIAALLVGILALRLLVRIVEAGRFWFFSFYLVPLGIALVIYALAA